MCTYAHAAINQDAGPQWQAVTAELHAAVKALQADAADHGHEYAAALAAQAAGAIAHFERTAGVAAPAGAFLFTPSRSPTSPVPPSASSGPAGTLPRSASGAPEGS
jgi:hypothetical protein